MKEFSVAGSALETLIITSNSFIGIFKQNFRTAILQISVLERIYFEVYIEKAKFFEKLQYQSSRANWEKNIFFKKYSILILFDLESIKNMSLIRLLVRCQKGLHERRLSFLWDISGPWLPLRKHFPYRLNKAYPGIGKHTH